MSGPWIWGWVVVGSTSLAGAAMAQDSDKPPTVERCPAELGTLAVSEPRDMVMQALGRYQLGSPTAMLRMIAQDSGCFAVVERGAGFQAMQQERALAAGGQLQADANVGGGQLQAADFVMTAAVQFAEETGGGGAVLGSLLGRAGGVLGALGGLAGGVKFKEAQTTLLVSDVRSGIQVASAEGNASKMNFSLGGWGWGGLGWAAAGGYSKSPEGKLIAASLLDNFNKIVVNIRNKPQLIRARSDASTRNAAMSTPASPQATTLVAPAAAPAVLAPGNGGGRHSATVVMPHTITVQPTVVAPQVMVLPADRVLPAGMVGAFSGQFSGQHNGIFSVLVAANGRVSGVMQSAEAGGSVPVTGMADPAGSFVMMGSNQGTTAQFSGLVDAGSGAMIGTWMLVGQNVQGTFRGKKE